MVPIVESAARGVHVAPVRHGRPVPVDGTVVGVPAAVTVHVMRDLRHLLLGKGRLRFTYDAGATNTAVSGQVAVRLRTGRADRIVELLTAA
jgi:hypothetical protein